jgi:hypothetical protein
LRHRLDTLAIKTAYLFPGLLPVARVYAQRVGAEFADDFKRVDPVSSDFDILRP